MSGESKYENCIFGENCLDLYDCEGCAYFSPFESADDETSSFYIEETEYEREEAEEEMTDWENEWTEFYEYQDNYQERVIGEYYAKWWKCEQNKFSDEEWDKYTISDDSFLKDL